MKKVIAGLASVVLALAVSGCNPGPYRPVTHEPCRPTYVPRAYDGPSHRPYMPSAPHHGPRAPMRHYR